MSNRRSISWGQHIASMKRAPLSAAALDARQAERAAVLARTLAAIAADEASQGVTGYTLRETDLSVPSYREFDVLLDGVAVAKLTDEIGAGGVWLVVNRGVSTLPPRIPAFAGTHANLAAACRVLGARLPV